MLVLKARRELIGMTQEELAKSMSVGQSAVSQWERGAVMPRAELLPQLAKVLGCTIDELFGEGERAS